MSNKINYNKKQEIIYTNPMGATYKDVDWANESLEK